MPQMIFVNLPVKDLDRSVAFFKALGYEFNAQFTDETATCMVISDTIFAMLLTEAKFRQFTTKDIADTGKAIETMIALSSESRDAVDETMEKALAAGATKAGETMDLGFMYNRSFYDLDGHMWEIVWMDPAAVEGAAA